MSVDSSTTSQTVLRYKIDEFLLHRRTAQFLLGVVTLVVVMFGIRVVLTLSGATSLDVWSSDPRAAINIFSVFFSGLVLYALLFVAFSRLIEARCESIDSGVTPVIENEFVLILGHGNRSMEILRQLVIGNEPLKKAVVVILSGTEKPMVDKQIDDYLDDFKTTKIITRTGDVAHPNELRRVGIGRASTITVLNDAESHVGQHARIQADARVLETITAITASTKDGPTPTVLAEFHTSRYSRLAEQLMPRGLTIVNETRLLARILVKASINHSLTKILDELIGFEGVEFYLFRPSTGWNDSVYGDVQIQFSGAVAVGVRTSNREILLNPSSDLVLSNDDQVVLLAHDLSNLELVKREGAKPRDLGGYEEEAEVTPKSYLIVGWNDKVPYILLEIGAALPSGSQVDLAVQNITYEIQEEFDVTSERLPNLEMGIHQTDLGMTSFVGTSKPVLPDLESLKPPKYDSILVLAQGGNSPQEIDAQTIGNLLEIRGMLQTHAEKAGAPRITQIITEMIDVENVEVVSIPGADDFILSTGLVSHYMAMLVRDPAIADVYDSLLSETGCELFVRPVTKYFDPKSAGEVTLAECVGAAHARNETCIGLETVSHRTGSDRKYELWILPGRHERFALTSADSLIVIADPNI